MDTVWRLLAAAVLMTMAVGCASAPKVGPCYVQDCGIECCNNDGKVCLPCP